MCVCVPPKLMIFRGAAILLTRVTFLSKPPSPSALPLRDLFHHRDSFRDLFCRLFITDSPLFCDIYPLVFFTMRCPRQIPT